MIDLRTKTKKMLIRFINILFKLNPINHFILSIAGLRKREHERLAEPRRGHSAFDLYFAKGHVEVELENEFQLEFEKRFRK